MGCTQRLKNYPNYTKAGMKIRDYILANLEETIHETAQSLAIKTDTSPSAIIRFSKNLGYRGFTELKVDLARNSKNNSDTSLFAEKIENNDSLSTVIKKAKASDENVITQTYALIDQEKMDMAIESLRKARAIYLVGIGSSSICCIDLSYKLLRIQMQAIHHTDLHLQMTTMTYISKDDVVIGISYSGETKEVINAMEFAKQNGATTISITQLSKNTLQKISTIQLYVPTSEKYLRLGAVTSRNASLILTDLLYIGLIRKDFDKYKEKLIDSHDVIEQFKKS